MRSRGTSSVVPEASAAPGVRAYAAFLRSAALRGPPATTARLNLTRAGVATTASITRDPQPLIMTVTIDSGVRLRLPAGQALSFDDQEGWWGAAFAGDDVTRTAPVNRSRNPAQPLTLPPGTYDVYWQRSQSAPPLMVAKGIVVTAGRVTDAGATLR